MRLLCIQGFRRDQGRRSLEALSLPGAPRSSRRCTGQGLQESATVRLVPCCTGIDTRTARRDLWAGWVHLLRQYADRQRRQAPAL